MADTVARRVRATDLPHTRFLQAQSVVVPVMASSAVTALAHVPRVLRARVQGGHGEQGRRAQRRRLLRRQLDHTCALRQAVRRLQCDVDRVLH